MLTYIHVLSSTRNLFSDGASISSQPEPLLTGFSYVFFFSSEVEVLALELFLMLMAFSSRAGPCVKCCCLHIMDLTGYSDSDLLTVTEQPYSVAR
jgi:protein-tyrosine phosphatase